MVSKKKIRLAHEHVRHLYVTGVIPGGVGGADSLYRPGGDRGWESGAGGNYGLGKVDEYGEVERFEARGEVVHSTFTPRPLAPTVTA